MTTTILAIILAGGRARRMGGGDKALMHLGDRPILAHLLDRLSLQVPQVVLNANGNPARFAAFGLPVLPDTVPGLPGPLAGVLAGLEHALAHGFTHVLSVPADTPFLPADLAARLSAQATSEAAAVVCAASHGRRHHAVALWSVSMAPAIAASLSCGERRLGMVAANHGGISADWGGPDPDPFFNINTEADLAAARLWIDSEN
jgi:molybdopterin-guanine dinucleotide biosynthesis protein A